jgi:hypothetical protein
LEIGGNKEIMMSTSTMRTFVKWSMKKGYMERKRAMDFLDMMSQFLIDNNL